MAKFLMIILENPHSFDQENKYWAEATEGMDECLLSKYGEKKLIKNLYN